MNGEMSAGGLERHGSNPPDSLKTGLPCESVLCDCLHNTGFFLQNHQQRSRSDQDAANCRLQCELLMQKDKCQYQGDDYRQLVDRNDF